MVDLKRVVLGSIRSMATVANVLDLLRERFVMDKAAGWDPVGLQLGDPGRAVTRVGVCHEVNRRVAAEAATTDIDLLVSYHPLIFRPLSRVVAGNGPAGRAFLLVEAGVALAVVHTAFDVATGGGADALASALQLGDTQPFGPVWPATARKIVTFVPGEHVEAVITAMTSAGAGTIGNYSRCSYRSEGVGTFVPGPGSRPVLGTAGEVSAEPETRVELICPVERVGAVAAALVSAHPYEEPAFDVFASESNAGFVGRVGSFAGSFAELRDNTARLGGVLRIAGTADPRLVAVVPGSGASLLADAADVGADVMVTGDVKHHDAVASVDRGVAVIDPGHVATERPGVAALYAAVAQLGEETLDLTGPDDDPWTG